MNEPKLELSYSQINTFLTCRRLWYWQYREDLTPISKGWPLKVGDVIHRLRQKYLLGELSPQFIASLPERVHELFPEDEVELNSEVAYTSARTFEAWLKEGFHKDIEIISPETILEAVFIEPITQTPYRLYARVDAMCRTPDGRLWRDELKTSSRTDPIYLKGLRSPLQTGISYLLIDELFDEKVKGTIFHMALTTKVPSAKRDFAPRREWVVEYAKQTVEGVVRDILHSESDPFALYPSLRCTPYSRECDYATLCKGATPRQREELYVSRKEAKEKSQNATF